MITEDYVTQDVIEYILRVIGENINIVRKNRTRLLLEIICIFFLVMRINSTGVVQIYESPTAFDTNIYVVEQFFRKSVSLGNYSFFFFKILLTNF